MQRLDEGRRSWRPWAVGILIVASSGCASGIGEEKAYPHSGAVYDLAFIPETDYFISTQLAFATRGETTTTRLWDIDSTRPIMEIVPDGISVDASRDGKLVAIGRLNGTVMLWDPRSRKTVREWKIETGSAICVAFSPDGSLLAVGQGPVWRRGFESEPLESYSIWVYDTDFGEITQAIKALVEYPVSIAIDHKNDRLLFSCVNTTALLWSLRNQDYIWQRDGRKHLGAEIRFGTFHLWLAPDDERFCWQNGVYDLDRMRLLFALKPPGEFKVTSGIFTPDGSKIVGGGIGGQLSVWAAQTGANLGTVTASTNGSYLTAIAVSPDGQYVLTGTEGSIGGFDALQAGKKVRDPYVRLWKLSDLVD
jgi:WD40 repeat protein